MNVPIVNMPVTLLFKLCFYTGGASLMILGLELVKGVEDWGVVGVTVFVAWYILITSVIIGIMISRKLEAKGTPDNDHGKD